MADSGFAIGPWEITILFMVVGIGGGGYILYLIIRALRKYVRKEK